MNSKESNWNLVLASKQILNKSLHSKGVFQQRFKAILLSKIKISSIFGADLIFHSFYVSSQTCFEKIPERRLPTSKIASSSIENLFQKLEFKRFSLVCDVGAVPFRIF
jgi:hypothetical protein